MARSDVRSILDKPDLLAADINEQVPNSIKATQLRSELAGLLVVSMAASYETCVKETLIGYASRCHPDFRLFAQNQYRKVSSKVSLNDLYMYARTFSPAIHQKFGEMIKNRKATYLQRAGKDITTAYGQILDWRHDFAHASVRNTTIEEALLTHRFAKRVMYTFNEAFS